jgi:hypothetical protein
MSVFNYIADIGGGDTPFIVKLKLAQNVDVKKGTALFYNERNKTVVPNYAGSDDIIGVCAADYKATKDEFCPDSGSGYVDVIVSKNALYSVPACVLKNVCGTPVSENVIETEIPERGEVSSDAFIGARLVLAEKSKYSAHDLSVGDSVKITDVTIYGGVIAFATDYNFMGLSSDKFIFVPEFGFNQLVLNEKGDIMPEGRDDGDMMIIAADENRYVVKFGRSL